MTTAGEVSGNGASARAVAVPPFDEFVVASSSRLFTLALLLCGQHRAEAEDLLQGVLERAYRRWARICRNGDPERYVRQMLANASVDRWRRLRRRQEQQSAPLPPVADQAAAVADRDLLLRALATLPPRQRAVIVLRYLDDLSEAQTAEALGCTVGTVKSQASRAMARLRQAIASGGGSDGEAAGGVGGETEVTAKERS